jgi:hypothetical protein
MLSLNMPVGRQVAEINLTATPHTCERKAIHPAHMMPKWVHVICSKADLDFRYVYVEIKVVISNNVLNADPDRIGSDHKPGCQYLQSSEAD